MTEKERKRPTGSEREEQTKAESPRHRLRQEVQEALGRATERRGVRGRETGWQRLTCSVLWGPFIEEAAAAGGSRLAGEAPRA